FLELTANNPSFAAFFLEDISHRLESLAQRTAQPGSVGAPTVRVLDALIHPPVFVPPATSLHAAALRMDEADQQALLLEDGGRAAGPPELTEAGERIAALVRQLHTAGTKIGFVTEISTELQRRLTARIFGLLAPEGLAEQACLVVMGSEGRGESLLATDQDN